MLCWRCWSSAFGVDPTFEFILGLTTLPILVGMLSPIPGGAVVREALMYVVARLADVPAIPVIAAALIYRFALFAAIPILYGIALVDRTTRRPGTFASNRRIPVHPAAISRLKKGITSMSISETFKYDGGVMVDTSNYRKHTSDNPVQRRLIDRFHAKITGIVTRAETANACSMRAAAKVSWQTSSKRQCRTPASPASTCSKIR